MSVITLGIDPGSYFTGWGVVHESATGEMKCLGYGVVVGPRDLGVTDRLLAIGQGVREIIQEFKPNSLSIEKVFFAKNADSALKLGQARGVILYEAAQAGLPIFEYNPTEVKSSIVGNGKAAKEQVQFLVGVLLNLKNFSKLDASDALALAIHHSRIQKVQDMMDSEIGRQNKLKDLET